MGFVENFVQACHDASKAEMWGRKPVLLVYTPDSHFHKFVDLSEKPKDMKLSDFLALKLLDWFKDKMRYYKEDAQGNIVPKEEGTEEPTTTGIEIPPDLVQELVEKAQELGLTSEEG